MYLYKFIIKYVFLLTITDINECELEADGCQHICNNVDGSFHCTCYPGYTLNTDSETCTGEFILSLYILNNL